MYVVRIVQSLTSYRIIARCSDVILPMCVKYYGLVYDLVLYNWLQNVLKSILVGSSSSYKGKVSPPSTVAIVLFSLAKSTMLAIGRQTADL